MPVQAFLSGLTKDPAKGFQLFGLARQGVVLVVGIMLAKSYLSLENIGIYEIWMFLGGVIYFMWLGGAFQGFTSFFPGQDPNHQEKAIFNTYLALSISTLLILFILWGGRNSIIPWLTGQSHLLGLGLLLCFLWLHLIAFFTPHIFLIKGWSHYFIPYSIFYFLGYLIAIAIPIMLGSQLIYLLQSLIVFACLEHLILWISIYKSSSLRIDWTLIKRFIIVAWPLALYAAIGSFAYIFDAWLVNWFYQKPEVFALFKYGARELPGALPLAGAFSTAMIPLIVRNKSIGLDRIKSGSKKLIHIFFPASIGLMILSPWLFKYIYNENFIASAQIFNMYLLLIISRFIFPNSILIGLQKGRILVGISFVELLVNIGLSFFLIKSMGLVGVALATVIAYFLEKILLVLYLNFKENISWFSYVPIKWWTFYSFGLVIAFLIGRFWVNY